MDAAQMLTAQEIVRQCEQLARLVEQRERYSGASYRGASSVAGAPLRVADPVTQPIPRVPDPAPGGPRAVEVPEQAPAPEPERSDGALSERERGILAFERQWWKRGGAKERLIHELFDMSAARYHQVLDALVDRPAALRADPMLVKRLRKARTSDHRAETARRLGIERD